MPLYITTILLLFSVTTIIIDEGFIAADAAAAYSAGGTIKYVNGQRCLLATSNSQRGLTVPPLVICVGMGQTIYNYEHHLPILSQDRDVLIYEPIGLGPDFNYNVDNNFDDDEIIVSLPNQAITLCNTIESIFGDHEEIDLAGFSLGGRIAMAATLLAQQQEDKYILPIRKLHITGVSIQRSNEGLVQLLSWKDLLKHGNVRGFAWSALLASYTPDFLLQNKAKLSSWVQTVCDSHTSEGLYALMKYAHPINNDSDEYSVRSMANKIYENNNVIDGRLLVGEYDILSPVQYVEDLSELLQWPVIIINNCGHSIPIEASKMWRDDLISFLSD